LIQPHRANLDAAGKKLTGEHTDFASLLNNRIGGIVRLSSQFWVVNLKIEPFQALAPCNEL
jgi:hypothetical protein